jgi:tetratricopeptide (TPR) repeat protein
VRRLLLLAIVTIGLPARAGPQGELERHGLLAVRQLVDGQGALAVLSLGRAREARARPELDALVGLVALVAGEHAAAERGLEGAITRGSSEPWVRYWAGRAALANGKRELALRRITEAAAIAPREPAIRIGQAILLRSLGRREAARAALLAVAEREPFLLSPVLYPTPVEGAIELLGPLLRGFPEPAALERTQAHLLWRAGRPAAALRRFERLASSPSGKRDGDLLQMLARALAACGRPEEALAVAERALAVAPGSPQALAARGEILLEQGKPSRAVADLRRAADALPRDGRLLARMAQACSEAERADCAERFYRHALNRDPRLATAHLGLALLLERSAPTRARDSFRRAIALDPSNRRAYQAAAQFARVQKDRRWAGELAVAERRIAPAVDRHRRQVEASLKLAGLGEGLRIELARDARCAAASCRALLQRLPPTARLHAQAGIAWRAGRLAEATRLATEVVDRLSPALLQGDPATVETRGEASRELRFQLRSPLPALPASRFK